MLPFCVIGFHLYRRKKFDLVTGFQEKMKIFLLFFSNIENPTQKIKKIRKPP